MKSVMKVLVSSNSAWNIKNFREDLIKKFVKEGINVVVMCPYDKSVECLKEWGCIHKPITINPRGKNPISELILFLKIFFSIYSINPDFVLSFTVKPNIYCGFSSRLLRRKIICNVTGIGSALIEPSIMQKLILELYKLAFKNALCFFQNRDDLSFFLSRKILKKHQTTLAPGSGINMKNFIITKVNKKPMVSKSFRFLFVGRILEDKGIVEFLLASKKFKQKFDVYIAVYGRLDKKLISNNTLKLFFKCIEDKVILYEGYQDKIYTHFREGDCLVLPSTEKGLQEQF